jgi:hypothetical protein
VPLARLRVLQHKVLLVAGVHKRERNLHP